MLGMKTNSSSVSYIKDSNQFDSLISELSKKYQVDFALIKAMIRTESGFNPSCRLKKRGEGIDAIDARHRSPDECFKHL